MPRQEHLLLLAERDSTTSGAWVVTYSERTSGVEESLESLELLAVGAMGMERSFAVIMARYSDDSVAYQVLQRTAFHDWTTRWMRRVPSC